MDVMNAYSSVISDQAIDNLPGQQWDPLSGGDLASADGIHVNLPLMAIPDMGEDRECSTRVCFLFNDPFFHFFPFFP